jgi:predicted enzyme related to lactoylglutathione lyase
MAVVKAHEPGTFSWADLGTTDSEEAKKFYTRLMGWKIHDIPLGPEGVYTMLMVDGKEVAALYRQNGQAREQKVRPRWQSYVSVKSADETADKAAKLGASVIAAPFDVFDAGRMAVLTDPTGAMFALWQPKKHIGATWMNDPGGLSWNELYTRDPEAAARFYTQLLEIQREWGQMPAQWLAYFTVADCDRAVTTARAATGRVTIGPRDIPNVGRFAVLVDPQGAEFAVIQTMRRG